MTDPITPPDELVQQWLKQFYGPATRLGTKMGTLAPGEASLHIAAAAAKWGADQELEACCSEVFWQEGSVLAAKLRDRRRPKPPSLKEQALEALAAIECDFNTVGDRADTIRLALEALPND